MAVYEKNSSLNSGHFTLAEQHLYGSSRLGIYNPDKDLTLPANAPINLGSNQTAAFATFERGKKFFELSNHLGNVLVTLRDDKKAVSTNGTSINYYLPNIVSASDYYPFGMQMPGRKFNAGNYRYGFNGKENDNDVKGEGNQQDYGMRIYDPRVGKFLSVDPLTGDFPWYTPYQYAGNKPIAFIDLDGLEEAAPKQPLKRPMLNNVSESTCIGCERLAMQARVVEAHRSLQTLKQEYQAWRANPGNFGKPLPSQFVKLIPDVTKSTFDQGGVLGSKDYQLFKLNYDAYGQYLPGPSDIVDGLTAIDELSKGNYTGAAAAAFFLIPGADVFKPIKSLKGAGGDLLQGYLTKFGNQATHLTKLDVQGALKDIAGTPVVINGKVFDHLKEVNDALSGVGNQLNKLTKDINAGKFTDEVLKQAEVIRGTLQKQKDKLTDVLNEAKKNTP